MIGIALDNFTRLRAVCKTSIRFANIVICSFRDVGAGIHAFDGEIVVGESWRIVGNRFFIAALCLCVVFQMAQVADTN